MKSTISSLLGLFLLASCSSGSADKKVPELANEMCACFTNFQKELSPEVVAVLKKVGASANPQQELMSSMTGFKPEDATAFGEKFASIGKKGSDVFNCLQAFDKKHGKETTKDKKALTESMLKQMLADASCPVGAAVVNLGLSNGVVK